ncbi:MAG: polyprenyl diphosphate synthase [Gammaproteobacteria bacterium]|nr:MAG: polyprenyl diphosphate synthase [Gammaproteobacteria bacterium]
MSSSPDTPVDDIDVLPRHVAIVMDGNGRWAASRKLPRIAGHRSGVKSVRSTIEMSIDKGIEVLTLFAFSSENWRRPKTEVSLLMELFFTSLREETRSLNRKNVRINVIGDRTAFSAKLRKQIEQAEFATSENTGLVLNIAANYGGRWDISQAAKKIAAEVAEGKINIDDISPELMHERTCLYGMPELDLFIRTGGDKRISNFLLWQLAYTELFFTETLWPNFREDEYQTALNDYATRQRRFGQTGEQVEKIKGA